jgi:hypothetical protein
MTDEDVPTCRRAADFGTACSVGTGPCLAEGTLTCSDNGAELVCDAQALPPLADVDTTLDGVDDDCDGEVDDDVVPCDQQARFGTVCSTGVGVCSRDGVFVCDEQNIGLTCDAVAGQPTNAVDDTLDGLDDDCDGNVDDDVPPCRLLAAFGSACSAGVGPCQTNGTQQCSADGQSLACSAVANPPAVTLDDDRDGIDDDCDGTADDDVLFPDRELCDPALGCCFDNTYIVPNESFFHVDEGGVTAAGACVVGATNNPPNCKRARCTDPFGQLTYTANPPASGPHMGCSWGAWNTVYEQAAPEPRGFWIHNLEHGGVLFLWGPNATPEAKAELLAGFATIPTHTLFDVTNNRSCTTNANCTATDGQVCTVATASTDCASGECINGRCRNTALRVCRQTDGKCVQQGCGHTLSVATFDPDLEVPVAVVSYNQPSVNVGQQGGRILLPDHTGIIPRAAALQFAVGCRGKGPESFCGNGPVH